MIEQLTIDHALHVCRNMDEIWLSERKALIDNWDPVVHAISMMQTPGPGYACVDETGAAVLVGGVQILRQGLGSTWMAGTPDFRGHVLEIARACRKAVRALINDGGLHRIQMTTSATSDAGHRWCTLLGLKFESRMHSFGLHGEDFLMYSLTREI